LPKGVFAGIGKGELLGLVPKGFKGFGLILGGAVSGGGVVLVVP
jgi:hypothetical protein